VDKMTAWIQLNVSQDAICQVDFTTDSYSIRVCDFHGVFEQVAQRDHVYELAKEYNCPIDPTINKDQLKALLNELESGIKGQGDSTLQLSDRVLTLSKPLASITLLWKFILVPVHSTLALVAPLSLGTSYYIGMVDSLIKLVQQRDAYIDTLKSKLEELGEADIAPRRRSKTIEPFDREKWQQEQRLHLMPRQEIDAVFEWTRLYNNEENAQDWQVLTNCLQANKTTGIQDMDNQGKRKRGSDEQDGAVAVKEDVDPRELALARRNLLQQRISLEARHKQKKRF
jgi:hypothetical protein